MMILLNRKKDRDLLPNEKGEEITNFKDNSKVEPHPRARIFAHIVIMVLYNTWDILLPVFDRDIK